MDWIMEHSDEMWTIVTSIVTLASLIVKLTPTLRDDDAFLPIVKVLGQLGLNKYGPTGEKRPKN